MGCGPWGHKEWSTTEQLHFHAWEKEMATHSSVLALENPRDGGAWWAAVYGVAQSRARLKRLSSSSRLLMRMKMKEPLGKIVWQFFK